MGPLRECQRRVHGCCNSDCFAERAVGDGLDRMERWLQVAETEGAAREV